MFKPVENHLGDMKIVERHLEPLEAHTLCLCLQGAGIPAETADVNLVQTDWLLTIAVGGASIRVPAAYVNEAKEVIAAYKRGEFALDDDFDEKV
jgi:hypothetical protein